jgi:hypothetical protein
MTDAFDILNSRKLGDQDFKKAVCEENNRIKEFNDKIHAYIPLSNKTPLLASSRRTGFVGILIALK